MAKTCTVTSGGRVVLAQSEMGDIFIHAEEAYPDEACGIVIGKPGDPSTNVLRRCANVANRYHQDDPIRYPRDAKTAYIMDPKDLLRIQGEADAKGLEFVVIYHSHPDHDAYFSETDRELALVDGEPLWPQLCYLVVSVKNRKVSYFKMFRWDSIVKQFTEEPSAILACHEQHDES